MNTRTESGGHPAVAALFPIGNGEAVPLTKTEPKPFRTNAPAGGLSQNETTNPDILTNQTLQNVHLAWRSPPSRLPRSSRRFFSPGEIAIPPIAFFLEISGILPNLQNYLGKGADSS